MRDAARKAAGGLLGAATAVLLLTAPLPPTAAAAEPRLEFAGRTVVVRDAPPEQQRAKFYDVTAGTAYLGQDETAPFSRDLPAAVGRVQVRLVAPDLRLEADVPAGEPTPTPTPPETSPTPTPPPGAVVDVATEAELAAALAAARPGQTIRVAAGRYVNRSRWTAAAAGTADAPITLTGSRAAVLASTGPTGNYGLWITGDRWRVTGLTVADATKGIVVDGARHVVLDGVEVRDVGDEGVHFRACSSDGVLRSSVVRRTGLRAPRFGEGVYVGSASSNWGSFGCDAAGRDGTRRTLVEGNLFADVAAEGADLKEGTDSGALRGNVFADVGWSGENSADSAVDAKGNGWVIEDNVVWDASGAFADAFQSHAVYPGYGTGNVFRGNVVEGPVPGFGFGLYPAAGNVVACDNSAPGAARGLVGDAGRPVACSP